VDGAPRRIAASKEERGRDDGGNTGHNFTCRTARAAKTQNHAMPSASARRKATRTAPIFGKQNNLASGNTKLLEQVFLPLLPIFLVWQVLQQTVGDALHLKNQKLFKILNHIESYGTYMEH